MKTQYDREVKTLSSNLGTVRFELETMKRKGREMEDNRIMQQRNFDGKYIMPCLV